MDGFSYPPGAGITSSGNTGIQLSTSSPFSPLAVALGFILTMLALLGVLIQLFRGRNCFMRCEENSTDANPAISMVQINGTNSNPGTDFVVPINVTPSNLSTHLVSLSATNSSPSTNLVTPLNGLNNTSLMAPLSTTVPFVPMNATGSNPICSFSAPVNSSNSDPVIRCTTLMNAVNSN